MSEQLSFIETQFPVSKVSKESYKERKANNGQTLTGLGKWWGRKPLILVRAALLGCLMPEGDNPQKSTEIFLKILSMDKEGLFLRKEKRIPTQRQYEIVQANRKLAAKYLMWFDASANKVKFDNNAPKEEIERAVFETLGYDEKLLYCKRPEQLENISEDSWNEINQYLGTSAKSLPDLIQQLSIKKFGHNAMVGDCFCGGGSIPFEASRSGCNTYASDLNPVAGLLTWADLHIAGASKSELTKIRQFQEDAYKSIEQEVDELGIEKNEKGERAVSYIYCIEAVCPECGTHVPMVPNWIIGRGTRTVVKLKKNGNKYDFDVVSGASKEELAAATKGTVDGQNLYCPCCGKSTPISTLRHDGVNEKGEPVYGLREWSKEEFEPRDDDVFHERLYCVKYEREDGSRYYRAPQVRDLENEEKIHHIVKTNFRKWQEQGLIPSYEMEVGFQTSQMIRSRGWTCWHHMFNVRQLFINHLFAEKVLKTNDQLITAAAILGLNKVVIFNSKLSMWVNGAGVEKTVWIFTNQALNPMFNYGSSATRSLQNCWIYPINNYSLDSQSDVELADARNVQQNCDLWITDPPYADAINYHELSEVFLSWDRKAIPKAFPDWYTSSKSVLAIKGDEHFSQTMIEVYSNLTSHMPDNGMQVVMFTHSDPAVWAQLAIIMWRAGLKVTAAWNIATETDASGLKNGNYVKGTVLLVLRKQTGNDTAFLDEINTDIRSEVKHQIASMQKLDDKEEPNFSDPDYVLAAYAASLKVLTSYAEIEDLDLEYELNQAISNPSGSKIVGIIENAKKVAYDCVIPIEFDSFLWRELSNAEKFYIKGLESEKHGNYQISTYQEFARGFSIAGYSQLMASEKANTARLKTPFEMAGRTINDVPDFENSLMRSIFQAIYVGIKEEMNPNKALGFLKNDLPNYWDKREMIQQILSFLVDIRDISNMQLHWKESAEMAEQLLTLVTHDSV